MGATFIAVATLVFTWAVIDRLLQVLASQAATNPAQVFAYVVTAILRIALLIAVPIYIGMANIHQYVDIGIGPDGLAVQVYLFFWKLVPWDSIVAVDTPWLPGERRYHRAIIVVRNLTVWNRLLALGTVRAFCPSVFITTYHENWKELLKDVSDRVDERAGWNVER
jgi:hypothetical protein